LGFLCVKRKQFEQALAYLEQGQILEPTNPKFIFEKATALMHCGRKEEALAHYAQVKELGPYVSGIDLAISLRGQGFSLIELERLDDAESAFRRALEIDPTSQIALNELRYIAHLRKGGAAQQAGSTAVVGSNFFLCVVCGKQFAKGKVVSVKGVPKAICQRCNGKLQKKWWQFWK
jgi:tetratricopeptide (TPR) repeat protein